MIFLLFLLCLRILLTLNKNKYFITLTLFLKFDDRESNQIR
jgi:hypothetical protein